VVAVLLLISLHPMASILVFASLGMVTVLTGGASAGSRRFRLMFAEVLWPALMLVVPMILIGAMRKTAMPPAAAPVTMVFALLLSVYVLLCEIRDLPLDAGQGMRTAATMVGRNVGTLMVFLGFAAVILVSTRAASMGYWHWTAPGVVALAALVCTWSLPSRNEDAAPALWMLASGYAALVAVTG
jgi:4-hydroxybenzoate polyprenyltransferase